jgi:WD40 repeat protein
MREITVAVATAKSVSTDFRGSRVTVISADRFEDDQGSSHSGPVRGAMDCVGTIRGNRTSKHPWKSVLTLFGRGSCAALFLLASAGCQPSVEHAVADTVASAANGLYVGMGTSGYGFVANVDGFAGPESVKYDADQDVYFVSNMNGPGSKKDGNGYISRMNAADGGSVTIFVQGGKNGAVLDAPKGMTIHGDTLWVCDITVLRAFHRRTGMPLGEIDFAPQNAKLLNDVTVGPDGTLRVTDTGIVMSEIGVIYVGGDRIFTVGPNRAISVMAAGPGLDRPNGISWDSAGKRWVVVSFDPFDGHIWAFANGDSTRHEIWQQRGTGKIDGVEALPNGAILFASWADSSIHLLENGRERQIVRQVPEPADIGVDTRRNRVAIPLSTLGRVQIWDLGSTGR